MFSATVKFQYYPKVADFYDGKSVFLTGATGFIGAAILENLLRCCPGIKTIYILVRSKKNVPPEVRKEQIFNKKIFEKIKEENRELLDKVHLIPGDASLPNLGMSEEDEQLLIEDASIVFHCAAIIHFTKPLEFTLLHNVLSLNSIIELCRKMRKLEVLVYTSTALSNCNHSDFTLKEEVYRLPFRAEKFVDALKNEDYEGLHELYSHCKPEWPNAYTFSKCLAENLIMDTASDLPVAIIRPSIVISTWKHPIPGYVEENSGIAALTIGVGKGFVKVLHADPNCKLNLVPVDIVSNAHVIAAWYTGTKRVYKMYRFYDTIMDTLNFFLFRRFVFERNNVEFLDKLLHPEDRKNLSLDFQEATFLDISLQIPITSPFYDWKIDKKSPLERKKTKHRRHILIKSIQGVFLLILSLLVYWIFSLIFL
ncbi:fatty acyl-CoA reductase 1-like isoform X2 [Argiope bruennichi]|uniref:fatty acyl-CoA reductase 1-like isoform X2 n=1 Tax=Argiope bruennichi TaxID=94029 RepID=UPI0024946803|nr:fatty acyl-CoA reductase 1-like isoform X2 [Argiope bruennichi]